MKTTFTFFSDAAHGWLKVPKGLLSVLGIEGNISHYSYDNNGYVYLEEDCDASRFIGAFKEKFNQSPIIHDRKPSKGLSIIRTYQRYDAVYEMKRNK